MTVVQTEGSAPKTQPQPLEPDFPSTASMAAVELDNLLRRRGESLRAVESLTKHLALEDLAESKESAMSLVDPSTYVVLNRAIHRSSYLDTAAKTTEIVFDEVSRIRGLLLSVISGTPEQRDAMVAEIEKLRAFCVALSKCAASFESSLEEFEPSHPFRR